MAHMHEEITIAAPAAKVWEILAALDHWPTWTPTVTRVECLDPGPPAIGSRVRITQPRLRPAVWEIDDWRAGQGFSWFSVSPGLKVSASHQLQPRDGACVLCLDLRFEGLLARPVAWLAGRITRQYLAQEARGLKLQVEAQNKS
jgi:uncharacterized membrane protein